MSNSGDPPGLALIEKVLQVPGTYSPCRSSTSDPVTTRESVPGLFVEFSVSPSDPPCHRNPGLRPAQLS